MCGIMYTNCNVVGVRFVSSCRLLSMLETAASQVPGLELVISFVLIWRDHFVVNKDHFVPSV